MRTVIIILCCVFVLLVLSTWIFTIQLKKLGPLYVNLIEDGDYVKMVISDKDDRNKILFETTLISDKTFTNKFLHNTHSIQDNLGAELLSANDCIVNFADDNKKYIIAVCTKAAIENYILHFFFSWFSEDKKYIICCSDADNDKGLFQYSPATEIEIISCGSDIADMRGMFSNCKFVKKINCKKLVTDKVTNMSWMFSGCSELEKLNLDNFDTRNVTDMSYMFAKCSSLKELKISSFNTTNVTNMEFMFWGCSSLTELKLSSFNTSNVQNMRGMFVGCINLLELDLSHFNTDNVTDMRGMFKNCERLTELNLSNFNFGVLQFDILEMFLNCDAINIICPGSIMGECHGNQSIGTINSINSADYASSNDIYNFYCKKGSDNHLYVIQYNSI